jgi:hypothetical protein
MDHDATSCCTAGKAGGTIVSKSTHGHTSREDGLPQGQGEGWRDERHMSVVVAACGGDVSCQSRLKMKVSLTQWLPRVKGFQPLQELESARKGELSRKLDDDDGAKPSGTGWTLTVMRCNLHAKIKLKCTNI